MMASSAGNILNCLPLPETAEERRHRAWREYARSYEAWIASLENQSAAGVRSASIQLARLKRSSKRSGINLLKPSGYDRPACPKNLDEDVFRDPADFAIDRTDPRQSIVDFDSVGQDEIKKLCEHFALALVWATKTKNGMQSPLLEMGIKWLAIFFVMRPSLVDAIDFRIPGSLTAGLRAALSERDPLETGLFFCKPLAWVRKCVSVAGPARSSSGAQFAVLHAFPLCHGVFKNARGNDLLLPRRGHKSRSGRSRCRITEAIFITVFRARRAVVPNGLSKFIPHRLLVCFSRASWRLADRTPAAL